MVFDCFRFRIPLYAVTEAAQIVDVPTQTLSRWARKYELVTYTQPGGPRRPSIPFVGLVEAAVLAALRSSGVPMQRIRPALAALDAEIGVAHALASKNLYTDGAELLFDYAESHFGLENRYDLVVVRNRQRVFSEIVMNQLERIEYGEDGYPTLIKVAAYPGADVIVDPTMSFGSPIFRRGGARVTDVLERIQAGESTVEVSEEFGMPIHQLEDVVRVASRRAA